MAMAPLGMLPQQQQHPLLAAVSGNNYASSPQQRAHYAYAQRPLLAMGTNSHGTYTGSGASGYGAEPSGSEYEHHSAGPPPPPAHAPSGGSYSYHATGGGTSYAAPGPPPASHHSQSYGAPHHSSPPLHSPAMTGGSAKGKKKSGGSSVMSALTLLSFFFFVNMLQSCLKDHMDAMNPTVMVMTAGVVRNRYNKLAEMNSREQQQSSSTSPTAAFTSGANIVVQPGNVVSAIATPVVALSQTPYSGGTASVHPPPIAPAYTNTNPHNYNNNNNNNNNKYNTNNLHNQAVAHSADSYRPDAYDTPTSYANHTLVAATFGADNRYGNNKYSNNHNSDHSHHHGQQNVYPDQRPPHLHHATYSSELERPGDSGWSYGAAAASPISSSSSHTHDTSSHTYKHYGGFSSPHTSSSPWSGAQSGHVGGNNYFNDDEAADEHRYGSDTYYTRIN